MKKKKKKKTKKKKKKKPKIIKTFLSSKEKDVSNFCKYFSLVGMPVVAKMKGAGG